MEKNGFCQTIILGIPLGCWPYIEFFSTDSKFWLGYFDSYTGFSVKFTVVARFVVVFEF
jgi:hypothetical protein